jgi:protein-disulfide isomerase
MPGRKKEDLKKAFRTAAWSLAVSVLPFAIVAQTPATPNAPGKVAAPAAGPQAPPANPFPPMNPKFFTATSPSVDTVNAFLRQLWGYDTNRIWSVEAILSTQSQGVAKVVVAVADKTQPGKTQQTVFFTLPDGKHAIADAVINFGATPFEDTRKMLQERADGPARGAAGKGLLLVEFTDLQCPHCKEAQPIMDQLATDFPQARVVFQNFPLVDIHPQAFDAAAVGVCVRKAKGDEAFYKYAQAVFDAQSALNETDEAATLNSAITKAGGDPGPILACSKTPATVENVNASVKLATDIGVDSTPTLYINGFPVPVNGIPYGMLKAIVAFRGNQDGVPVTLQPSLKTLK